MHYEPRMQCHFRFEKFKLVISFGNKSSGLLQFISVEMRLSKRKTTVRQLLFTTGKIPRFKQMRWGAGKKRENATNVESPNYHTNDLENVLPLMKYSSYFALHND